MTVAAMIPDPTETAWIGTPAAARILAVLAAAIWGAIFGSFVNVLVHRLPRGESPFAGRSRCPTCQTEIRARDNIPVVGWILRRGSCRACGGRIAVTYPLVEAACGLLWAVLAAAGAVRGDVDRLFATGDWAPLLAWTVQAVALLCLVAWALLEDRGGPLCPGAWPMAAAVVATAALFPHAGPPGLLPSGRPWPPASPAVAGALAALAGAAVGRLGGLGTGTGTGCCGLVVLGAVTGWQTVTVVALVTVAARSVAERLSGAAAAGRRRTVAIANTILIIAAAASLAIGSTVRTAVLAPHYGHPAAADGRQGIP